MIALLRWDHWWKRCRRADCRRRHSGGSPVLGHRHSLCWVPLVGAPAQSLPAVPTAPGTLKPTIHTHVSSKEIILTAFVPHPACYECQASVNEETASASAFTVWAGGDACGRCTMRGRGHRSCGARSRWRRLGAGSEPRRGPASPVLVSCFCVSRRPAAFPAVFERAGEVRPGSGCARAAPPAPTPASPSPAPTTAALVPASSVRLSPHYRGGGHLILPGEAACLS